MKPFDQRWQSLAQHARRTPDETPAELPFGFAARIMANLRESERAESSWADLLSIVGLRAVVATTCVFLASAGFAFAEWYEFRIEPPALETAVTSALNWP